MAQYRETYNTGFLVTSASVQQFGVIALIGYLRSGTFPVSMAMIYDYKNHLLFNGNKRKFDLSTQLVYGQVEGIEFSNTATAFVTNELYTNGSTIPQNCAQLILLRIYLLIIYIQNQKLHLQQTIYRFVQEIQFHLPINLQMHQLHGSGVFLVEILFLLSSKSAGTVSSPWNLFRYTYCNE
ncbi:MAG: hypothetical protein IPN13_07500 [Bacteroidetes bacterium]|nr:hypothetical protein [Bacteroidota bacterium]